jgi:hypothetical protein
MKVFREFIFLRVYELHLPRFWSVPCFATLLSVSTMYLTLTTVLTNLLTAGKYTRNEPPNARKQESRS